MTAPTPENALPTAGQLAEWLGRATEDQRVRFAQRYLDNAERAAQCFIGNHEHQIEALRQQVEQALVDRRRLAVPSGGWPYR